MVIEDNIKLKEKLELLLHKYGYEVIDLVPDENFIDKFKETTPHLVLLDINLPYFDGFYFCKEIRKISNLPIIFVTSRDSSMDEVMGMTIGGDDFITKPYNPEVLLARINAVIRRSYTAASDNIEHNGVILNIANYTVSHKNNTIELTKNEFKILHFLLQNNSKLVSRDDLMNYLWNDDVFLDDNTLTVNVNRLRKRLQDIGVDEYITTKRGQGYMIL